MNDFPYFCFFLRANKCWFIFIWFHSFWYNFWIWKMPLNFVFAYFPSLNKLFARKNIEEYILSGKRREKSNLFTHAFERIEGNTQTSIMALPWCQYSMSIPWNILTMSIIFGWSSTLNLNMCTTRHCVMHICWIIYNIPSEFPCVFRHELPYTRQPNHEIR